MDGVPLMPGQTVVVRGLPDPEVWLSPEGRHGVIVGQVFAGAFDGCWHVRFTDAGETSAALLPSRYLRALGSPAIH